MFTHLMLGANDLELSREFYDATMQVLGYDKGHLDPKGRYFYLSDNGVLCITKPINGDVATHGNGSTVGLKIDSPELVDAWYAAGIAAGGTPCEDAPGIRESSTRKMYLAYLRDPAGNKLCGTHIMA